MWLFCFYFGFIFSITTERLFGRIFGTLFKCRSSAFQTVGVIQKKLNRIFIKIKKTKKKQLRIEILTRKLSEPLTTERVQFLSIMAAFILEDA